MKRFLPIFALLAATPAVAAPTCKGLSVTPLQFLQYDVYATSAATSTATISYSCPPPLVPTVTIDGGTSNSYSPRYMLSGSGEKLAYNVYSDAAMQTIWGQTPVSVAASNGTSVTVYAQVFAGQDVTVGTYTDTLTVTFNF